MKRQGLARLVEALLAETRFPWIRFLYAYPKTLDESVLDVMAANPRFVVRGHPAPARLAGRPLADAPRGRRRVVRRPDRGACAARAGHRDPDDVHRGVPWRKATRSSRSSASSSARRSSTISASSLIRRSRAAARSRSAIPVPAEEKERRRDFLLSLQQPIARRKARALEGRTVEALIEGPCDETEHLLEGRHPLAGAGDRRAAPDQRHRAAGTSARARSCPCEISETHDYDLVGRIVRDAAAAADPAAGAMHVIRDPLRATDLPRRAASPRSATSTACTAATAGSSRPSSRRRARPGVRRSRSRSSRIRWRSCVPTSRRRASRPCRQKEEALEAIGIEWLLVDSVHAGFLADGARGVRAQLPGRAPARPGGRARRAFRLRPRQARRSGSAPEPRSRMRIRGRRRRGGVCRRRADLLDAHPRRARARGRRARPRPARPGVRRSTGSWRAASGSAGRSDTRRSTSPRTTRSFPPTAST